MNRGGSDKSDHQPTVIDEYPSWKKRGNDPITRCCRYRSMVAEQTELMWTHGILVLGD